MFWNFFLKIFDFSQEKIANSEMMGLTDRTSFENFCAKNESLRNLVYKLLYFSVSCFFYFSNFTFLDNYPAFL